MSDEAKEEAPPERAWSVAWGNEIHVGDLVKLKTGAIGEGRVLRIRRDSHRCPYGDHEHVRLGLIVELSDGQQHGLWIDDTDTVKILPAIPEGMPIVPSQEGE